MVDMINKSGLPVMGVYFGSPSPDHWTSDDILSNKRGFLTEFATVCGQKEPIYARVRIDFLQEYNCMMPRSLLRDGFFVPFRPP